MDALEDSQQQLGSEESDAKRRKMLNDIEDLKRSLEAGNNANLGELSRVIANTMATVARHSAESSTLVTNALVEKVLPKNLPKDAYMHAYMHICAHICV